MDRRRRRPRSLGRPRPSLHAPGRAGFIGPDFAFEAAAVRRLQQAETAGFAFGELAAPGMAAIGNRNAAVYDIAAGVEALFAGNLRIIVPQLPAGRCGL